LAAAMKSAPSEAGPMEHVDMDSILSAPTAEGTMRSADWKLAMTSAFAEYDFYEQSELNAEQATVRYFNHLAAAYAGTNTRKTLLWITSSFPFDPDREQFVNMTRRLNHANIVVYPVDARGFIVDQLSAANSSRVYAHNAAGAEMDRHDRTMGLFNASLNNMKRLAEQTGGKAFYNDNNLTQELGRAADDASDFYLLSYALEPDDDKPGWRSIKAEVSDPHYTLSGRNGFYIDPPKDVEQSRMRELISDLDSPLDSAGLILRLQLSPGKPGNNGKTEIGGHLRLPPNSISTDAERGDAINVDFAYSVQDHHGRIAYQHSERYDSALSADALQALQHFGLGNDVKFSLLPGSYTIHVAVHDNLSGRKGTLSFPLHVK